MCPIHKAAETRDSGSGAGDNQDVWSPQFRADGWGGAGRLKCCCCFNWNYNHDYFSCYSDVSEHSLSAPQTWWERHLLSSPIVAPRETFWVSGALRLLNFEISTELALRRPSDSGLGLHLHPPLSVWQDSLPLFPLIHTRTVLISGWLARTP